MLFLLEVMSLPWEKTLLPPSIRCLTGQIPARKASIRCRRFSKIIFHVNIFLFTYILFFVI